ncbi:hypothetical protein MKEN_00008000 [Mycena kentingensis (nom. inval.)]|nr:hypothetical protein MKEN_00008000 [Mycena kentingensis (nom. inval.)]
MADVVHLIIAVFRDTTLIRTTHGRIAMVYALLVMSLSAERPGALVEGRDFRHTNASLRHGNHQVWILPNSANPSCPFVVVIVTIDLLKGYRDDDSKNKMFFLLPEPDSHRPLDAVMYGLALALMDGVFEDVSTTRIEEIFHPKNPPTRPHMLRYKPGKAELPVFRQEVISEGAWVMSPTLAMPYAVIARRLKVLGERDGFEPRWTFYCLRRCSANNLNAVLSEQDTRTMMGQTDNSRMFEEHYKTRLMNIDLGAIFAERTDNPNRDNIAVMKTLTSMGSTRDPRAPTRLDAAELTAIDNEPELVALRVEEREMKAQLGDEEVKLMEIPEDDEAAVDAQAKVVRELGARIKSAKLQHKALVSQEIRIRLAEKRKLYFAGASGRELRGEAPPTRVPMAARNIASTAAPSAATRGKENVPPTSGDQSTSSGQLAGAARLRRLRAVNPVEHVLTIMNNFALDAPPSSHIVESINALLALPTRPFPLCYPGESPTLEGKCPVCDQDLLSRSDYSNSRSNTATHLHACLLAKAKEEAMEQLEDEHDRERHVCTWGGCSAKGKPQFKSHGALAAHIRGHLLGGHPCRLDAGGAECGEVDCDQEHIGAAHEINVWIEPRVRYCVLCADMFVDYDGDGADWEGALRGSFRRTLFRVYDSRDRRDFSDHGVNFTAESTITFDNGEGFGGARPEVHGHVERLVALAPAFCPCCLFNTDLPIPISNFIGPRSSTPRPPTLLARFRLAARPRSTHTSSSINCNRSTWGPTHKFADWVQSAPAEIYPEPGPVQGVITRKTRQDNGLPQYKCVGCNKEHRDILLHFNGLRSATSKCLKKVFKVRGEDGKFGPNTTLTAWHAEQKAASGSK